jgi:hypothetical protein
MPRIVEARFVDADPGLSKLTEMVTHRSGPARLAVMARFDDGTEGEVAAFYTDELTFTEREFIGLTRREAQQLWMDRDTAYLRS